MNQLKPPFIFSSPSEFVTEEDFLMEVPSGVQTKVELLAQYQKEGNFPAYFGHNWDALLDCLRDFSWTKQKRIVLVHKDLPLANREDELRIYLEILETAVKDWREVRQGTFAESPKEMPYVEHELIVVFPPAVEGTLIHVLGLQND